MNFSKPSKLPEWATTETKVVEADSAHKANGWQYQERPAHEHANWLHNLTYKWLGWLDQERGKAGACTTLYSPYITGRCGGAGALSISPTVTSRISVKRLSSGTGYGTPCGFGMVDFFIEFQVSAMAPWVAIALPTSSTYGPFVPNARYSAGGAEDIPAISKIAAVEYIISGGIYQDIPLYAVAMKHESDGLGYILFSDKQAMVISALPSLNVFGPAVDVRYRVAGSMTYPLEA